MNGAKISSPTASPNHQVSQIAPNCSGGAKPVRVKLVVPTVALTTGLSNGASTRKRKVFRARSNALAPLAKVLSAHAAKSASKVFPVAMPSVVTTVPCVARFKKNAPTKIPGHKRQPQSSSAAKATPLGGQTGETLM